MRFCLVLTKMFWKRSQYAKLCFKHVSRKGKFFEIGGFATFSANFWALNSSSESSFGYEAASEAIQINLEQLVQITHSKYYDSRYIAMLV